MTPEQFGKHIGRRLTFESIGAHGFRCFFREVTFAEHVGPGVAACFISGSGPNHERARADFTQKIRGKWARVRDGGSGQYREFPVPRELTP